MTDAARLARNIAISKATGASSLAQACAAAKPPTTIRALAAEIGVDKAALFRYGKGRPAPAEVVEKVWKRVRFRLTPRD